MARQWPGNTVALSVTAYFNLPPETTVAGVWIALDQATPENGCMFVIPGSHRAGPVVHFKRRDWQICDTDVAAGAARTVPLTPGGCLIFHGLLHHGTPPSRSPQRRRALQFHYKPASVAQIAPEERLAVEYGLLHSRARLGTGREIEAGGH